MRKAGRAGKEDTPKVVEAIGGVQSLHRAMSILQSVAHAREGIGLAELSKEVDLHTSTTFHLAKTLVEDTGENSHLAVSAGKEVVIIGKCDGGATIRLAERVGSARPPHATAIGKVLLSALTPPQLDKLLATLPLDPITPKTIVDIGQLKEAIREAGKNGIAFDDGESYPDVRCLAAPVFDFRNRMIAAIGISAPIWRFGLNRIGEFSALVQDAARNLSQQLGHRSDRVARDSAE